MCDFDIDAIKECGRVMCAPHCLFLVF